MVRVKVDKSSNDYQTRSGMARSMDPNGKSRSESKKKTKWKNEKPKLDNARRLRGICFIDSDDEEYKDTLKHARRKLEVPMEAAMHCKKEIHSSTRKLVAELSASHKVPKTKYRCMVRPHVY